MTLKDSILLPSQETLLQRLQHVSLYGQQLLVVTGAYGSGKTTLVTSLLNELDEFSSALVTCPKHSDCSEIRRKILVQLLSEPVFDDELPLPETLLRLSGALPQASCIVLDDAHYLPMEIIAECIVLSQLSIPGKSLSVALTTTADFFEDLVTQLPEQQQEILLSINIDPLTFQEREALYYTLLSRSEQVPFTPREIVKEQLAKQSGNPQEVVNLLELALHGEPDIPVSRQWNKLALVGGMILLSLVLGYVLLSTEDKGGDLQTLEKTVLEPELKPSFLYQYGERLLAGYFVVHQTLPVTSFEEIESLSETQVQVQEDATPEPTVSDDSEALTEKKIEPALSDSTNEASVIEEFKGLADIESTQLISAEIGEIRADNGEASSLPDRLNNEYIVTGYTLQLASVRQIKSLYNILERLQGETDIKVARYKQRWVVLFGHFDTSVLAHQKAEDIVEKYQLNAPWVRPWKNLVDYELQDSLPARDIPQ
ncbi:sporulation domain protein [Shewanella sediminis HAW-EB3]|uniref:Sporulation domain protein n=1 Tax=Shewanella sediminis (strain HAW-EB3) TaxID=425104 RepID=A8G194_SHESH|nr:AAA family ATPase [Shewanella sediminis]ABV38867.1 sporulation domain protein [Shewanella sediminis HAW-EB3]